MKIPENHLKKKIIIHEIILIIFWFSSTLLKCNCKPTHGYSVKMPCRNFDFPVLLETESFWKLDLEKWEMDLATGLVLPTDRNLGRPWIPSNCHSIFHPRLKFKVLIFCFNIGGQTLYQPLAAEVQKRRSIIQIFCSVLGNVWKREN